MSYISFLFFGFLFIALALYYIVPLKWRKYVLLCANVVFYAYAGISQIVYLAVLIVLTYFSALLLQKIAKHRFLLLLFYLFLSAGALVYGKFINYILRAISSIAGGAPLSVSVIVPLGVSFFTLQAIGYVVDVYKHKYPAEKNFLKVALFMSYFPIIVQGPISRMETLSPQLFEGNKFDYTRVKQGLLLMLWGLFKKLVIANRAAMFADPIFGGYEAYSGFTVVFGVLMYTLQIYTDFSGCVDLCRGVSEMFGITMMDNFDHPYFSTSIKDFWRRWHISLSSWLRDYVYIPLGGNRRGKFRKYLNLMITFLVSGLWHGVGIHYLVWGFYHGACQIVGDVSRAPKDYLIKKLQIRRDVFSFRLAQQLITFVLIAYSWLLFRANGFRAALYMTRSLFTNFFSPTQFATAFGFEDLKDLFVLIIATVVLLMASLLQQKYHIRTELEKQNLYFRWGAYLIILFAIIIFGVYGTGYNASDFLYMQF